MKILTTSYKTTLLMVALFLGLTSFGRAEGRTSAQFLELGGGARYQAMGEAAASVVNDANAIHWNPAQLSNLENPSLSLMYGAYVESMNYQYFAYARPTETLGAFGFSLQSFNAGSIRETDENGQVLGSFNPRDTALTLGWGKEMNSSLSFGLSGKYIHSKIINSASTWAMDAGIAYEKEYLQLAAAVRNLGGRLTYDRESNALPTSTHLSGAYQIKEAWLVSSEIIYAKDTDLNFALGSEYGWKLNTSEVFMRAGYNSRTNGVPGFAGMSLGFGLKWSPVQIDYAWIPFGDLDQTHRISLTLSFGKKDKRDVYNLDNMHQIMKGKGNDKLSQPSPMWTPSLSFPAQETPKASTNE